MWAVGRCTKTATRIVFPHELKLQELTSAIDLVNEVAAVTPGTVTVFQESGGGVRAKVVMEIVI